MTLTTYQSHKRVKADKIISYIYKDDFDEFGKAKEIILTSEDGTEYTHPVSLFARGEPTDDYFYLPDDYFYLVQYEDDYTSWSPKKAFEEGYELVGTEEYPINPNPIQPNRVSFEQIENLKNQLTYEYVRTGEAGTICNVYLGTFRIANGYSACVDPASYSQELGEQYSKERAVYNATNALWEFMGFALFKDLNPEIFVTPKPVLVSGDFQPA